MCMMGQCIPYEYTIKLSLFSATKQNNAGPCTRIFYEWRNVKNRPILSNLLGLFMVPIGRLTFRAKNISLHEDSRFLNSPCRLIQHGCVSSTVSPQRRQTQNTPVGIHVHIIGKNIFLKRSKCLCLPSR